MGAEVDYTRKPARRAVRDPQPEREDHLRLRQQLQRVSARAAVIAVRDDLRLESAELPGFAFAGAALDRAERLRDDADALRARCGRRRA